MVAGDWQPLVPAATVGPPCLADGVVPRPALVDRLLAAGDGDLVVLTAPAGYGKTTAVTLWDRADERPFAWLRLDHLDDDPAHLVLHIATALQRTCRIEPEALRYLRGPGRAPLTHLVPALAVALESIPAVVVVLDDTQELSSPDALAALRAFVDSAPASTTVALVGRCTPAVDLARRRLHRRVVEIGTADLALSDEQATAAFTAVGGPTDDASVAAVLSDCEGWAAGVVLAALAKRDGADADTLIARHRLVSEYLVEEVLGQLDRRTETFLVESAVLERFCTGYLDEVLERDDSARMLAALVTSGNLFLVPLDEARMWYRYHRLFGDLLRTRLRDHDPGRFCELARRAADVLEADGDIDGAVLQAVAAGDRERAAALVGRDAMQLGFGGRAGALARRVGLLDERTFADYPDAAIAGAWLGVTTGDAELIQRSLVMASRADRGQPLADGTPSVKVAAALVGSLVGTGGVRDVLRHSTTVRGAGDNLVNPCWGAATVMKGAARSMLGETAEARVLLESALPVIEELPGFHAAALAHLALLDLDDGEDGLAVERSLAARKITDTHGLSDVVPMVVVYAVSAVTAARVGDIAAARTAVVVTDRLLSRLGNLAARTALLGHGLLAWTAAVLEDRGLLAEHLEAAERARNREPEAIGLSRRIDRVRALAVGRQRRALTAAELRLLPHLATHLSLQRIADELLVGRETAKSQVASNYRKLGVSSRAAAVAEAKRTGLLAN